MNLSAFLRVHWKQTPDQIFCHCFVLYCRHDELLLCCKRCFLVIFLCFWKHVCDICRRRLKKISFCFVNKNFGIFAFFHSINKVIFYFVYFSNIKENYNKLLRELFWKVARSIIILWIHKYCIPGHQFCDLFRWSLFRCREEFGSL